MPDTFYLFWTDYITGGESGALLLKLLVLALYFHPSLFSAFDDNCKALQQNYQDQYDSQLPAADFIPDMGMESKAQVQDGAHP